MLNEVGRARITLKIDALQKERTGLEQKYEETKSLNESAWSTYGSELCAGGMIQEEKNISDEIAVVSDKIKLLQEILDGRFDLDQETQLNKRIKSISETRQRLDQEEKSAQKTLEKISFIKSTLSGQ